MTGVPPVPGSFGSFGSLGVPPGWPVAVVRASSSPRRLDLLRSIGVEPEVRPADIDETPWPGGSPGARLASR